jgi:hypothetical protein
MALAPPPISVGRSDDDLLHTITHALQYRGRKRTTDADRLMARIVAERILEPLRQGYEIRPDGYRHENMSSPPPKEWQPMKTTTIRELVDAADDLPAIQQQMLGVELPVQMRSLRRANQAERPHFRTRGGITPRSLGLPLQASPPAIG